MEEIEVGDKVVFVNLTVCDQNLFNGKIGKILSKNIKENKYFVETLTYNGKRCEYYGIPREFLEKITEIKNRDSVIVSNDMKTWEKKSFKSFESEKNIYIMTDDTSYKYCVRFYSNQHLLT